MAFVYRTSEKENRSRVQTPGPGSYFNLKKHIEHNQAQHIVPFNHSQNREIWKTTIAPGPGSYQSENLIKKQKKLVSDIMGGIVVYQTPSESVAFKSKTIRFTTNSNSNNPGPGEYNSDIPVSKPVSGSKKVNRPSSQLKQFLKQKSNILRNDYDDDKEIVVSAKDDWAVDNQHLSALNQTENRKQQKNSIFFASKVERNINKTRPQTSAGPGSYNITKSTFEVQKKFTKKIPAKSICIDKKIQKVQTEEVGPGYYDVDQAFKNLNHAVSSKKKKIQCFGSTVDRFHTFKNDIRTTSPGPAAYTFLNHPKTNADKPKTPVTSFPKEQRRIFQSPKNTIIPISYTTSDNFSSVVKQKFQRKPSVKECFGSTKSRFQEKVNQLEANKTSNEELNLLVLKRKQDVFSENQIKQAKMFKTLLKTRQKKRRFEQNFYMSQPKLDYDFESSRPLCYDTEANTLSYKYGRKSQAEAPFMSGAERFRNSSEQKFIDLDSTNAKSLNKTKNIQSQQRLSHRVTRNKDAKKLGWIAISKDERFKYEDKSQILGPQHYDPVLPQKRSYNVLFS